MTMTIPTSQEPGIIESQFKNTVLEKGYGLVSREVMFDETLSVTAKAVYSLFVSMVGAKDYAWPSVEFILHKLQISRNSFFKYIKELKQHGFINTEQKRDENNKFKTTHYYIILSDSEIAKLKVYNAMTDEERKELARREQLIEKLSGLSTADLESMISENDTITPRTKICDTAPCTKICDAGRVPNFGIPKNGTQIIEDQIITSNKDLIIENKETCVTATPDTPPAGAKGPKEQKVYDFTDFQPEAVALAVRLAIGVKQNHPKTPKKQCPDPELSPDNELLWKWVHQLELLNQIGITGADKAEGLGWSWDEIEAVIEYALNDRRFWSRNARSAFTIREKADKIHDAMRDEAAQRKKPRTKAAASAPAPAAPAQTQKPKINLAEPFDDEGIYLIMPGETRAEAYMRVDDLVAYGKASAEKMAIFRERTAYRSNVG